MSRDFPTVILQVIAGGKMEINMRTICGWSVIFILLAGSWAGLGGSIQANQEVTESQSDLAVASVDELMKVKTVDNCLKAIKKYEQLLKNSPDNLDLLVKISDAYITIIDIKTDAMIEEKDEHKPLLAEYGKIAYDYAQKAMKINSRRREVVAVALVAYGYYSSSFGIVKAIFKGAAGRYKDLAKRLIEIDDTYDGALGYRSLGKLYEVAPWPVGSSRKALKYFKLAVDTDPASLYSHYYLGLMYFNKDKFDMAKKEFEIVVNNLPQAGERHFIQAYKERARDYIAEIAGNSE